MNDRIVIDINYSDRHGFQDLGFGNWKQMSWAQVAGKKDEEKSLFFQQFLVLFLYLFLVSSYNNQPNFLELLQSSTTSLALTKTFSLFKFWPHQSKRKCFWNLDL